MAVNARLTDGYKTTITNGNHTWYADESIADGGTDEAIHPMGMALGALASCMAITMKMYALRKGWDVQSIEVSVDSERFRARDYPEYEGDEKYVHEIREKVEVSGNLTDEQRERIMEIGERCPVRRLISTPSYFKSVE